MKESATLLQLMSNVLMFVILLYVAKNNLYDNKKNVNLFVIIGIVVFCLFAFWGSDYYRYKELFTNYYNTQSLVHIEKAYEPIFRIATNYIVFRLIIWGGALLILLWAFHRLNLQMDIVLFVFLVLYLLRFSYARVSLGVAIMFLGYSFLINPFKPGKLVSFVIGLLLLFFSLSFHKTMLLAIIAIPLAFLKWNRSTLLFAMAFFPLLVFFVNTSLVEYILANNLIEDEQQLYAINSYMSNYGKESGWGIKLANLLQALPFYLCILVYFRDKKYYHLNTSEKTVQRTFSLLIAMVFIASAFVFRQALVYRRLLYMTYPAFVAAIAEIWKIEGKTKWINTVLTISIVYQAYELLYAIYCMSAR